MPRRSSGDRIRVDVEAAGFNYVRSQLRQFPDDIRRDLRSTAQEASHELAEAVISAGESYPDNLIASIAGDVGIIRGAAPGVRWPGRAGVTFGRNSAPVSAVVYGAEFGGQGKPTTMQFLPHAGQEGHVFFPTVRRKADEIVQIWAGAIDDWVEDWNRGR